MTLDIRYPRSWSEMTPRQLLQVAGVLEHASGPRDEILLRLLCSLAGLRIPLRERLRDDVAEVRCGGRTHRLPAAMLLQAARELSFILDGTELTACPLEGISPKLYDIPFGDYFHMDALMMLYAAGQAQDRSLAAEAARCLTHRRRRLDGREALALLIWYNGLKHWLAGRYPNVFEKGGVASSDTMAETLSKMLAALNQERPQDNEAILAADTHAVLLALENTQLKYKTLKRHAEQGIH